MGSIKWKIAYGRGVKRSDACAAFLRDGMAPAPKVIMLRLGREVATEARKP